MVGRQTDERNRRWAKTRQASGKRQKRRGVQDSLTLNPVEFFFASAFSRVAFKTDFVFL